MESFIKKMAVLTLTLFMTLTITPVNIDAEDMVPTSETSGFWSNNTDTSWYNATDTTFTIKTAEQLAGLAKLVNEGTDSFDGKTIYLGDNIDLKDYEWVPIGITVSNESGSYTDRPFKGTFDGQGHTVSNLTMTSADLPDYCGFYAGDDYAAYGFFGGVKGGKVTDIVFTDVNINKPGKTKTSANNDMKNNTVGIVVGAAIYGTEISNITVYSGSATGHARVGGIVGFVGMPRRDTMPAYEASTSSSSVTIKNCINRASITSTRNDTYGTAGGICATVNSYSGRDDTNNWSFEATFDNNANYGMVNGFTAAGIIASTFFPSGTKEYLKDYLYLTNNVNNGAITASGNEAGAGIAVTPNNNGDVNRTSIDGNVNNGAVTAANGPASGLVSSSTSAKFGDKGNINNGDVTGAIAGGISAYTGGTEFKNLKNTGNITSNGSSVGTRTPKAGGIVGEVSNSFTLDGTTCINTGVVTMNGESYQNNAGNLIGFVHYGTLRNISDDNAIGTVTVCGNGEYTVVLDNVQLSELYMMPVHTQSNYYTIDLNNNSSVGNILIADSKVNTGMNIRFKDGTIEDIIVSGVTNNDGENTTLSLDFKNSKIGTVNTASDSNKFGSFRITSDSNSNINLVETAYNLSIGYTTGKQEESNYQIFKSEGTISTAKNSQLYVNVVEGSKEPNSVVLVTNDLTDDAKKVLKAHNYTGGGSAAKNIFDGVELTSNTTLSEDLTISPNRTLTIKDGVTLTLDTGVTLTNNGSINKVGTASIKQSESNDEYIPNNSDSEQSRVTSTPTIDIAINGNSSYDNLKVDDIVQLSATITKNSTETSDYTPTWSSNNESVATVGADGKVAIIGEGSATITASVTDESGTVNASDSIVITVGHSWDTGWTADETGHWHKCLNLNCESKNDYAEHEYDQKEATEVYKVEGRNNEYYYSCECGRSSKGTLQEMTFISTAAESKVDVSLEVEDNDESHTLDDNSKAILADAVANLESSNVRVIEGYNLSEIIVTQKQDVRVKVTVKEPETPNTEDVKTISESLRSNEYVLRYLEVEIELYYIDTNTNEVTFGYITNLSSEITIPYFDNDLYLGNGYYYFVVRVHDGEFARLSSSVPSSNTIRFDSDLFSTYAICYRRNTTNSSTNISDTDPCTIRIGTGWVYDEAKGYCVYKGSGQVIPNTSVK